MNISTEWTEEERLNLVAFLANQLLEVSRVESVPREQVFDVSNRIILLLTQPPEFLETNRNAILEGHYKSGSRERK